MPRYGKSHKPETRQRIIDSAGRRMKSEGIDGSGILALMSDAGLTNGAFYAHFDSKADLVAHMVDDQLTRQAATLTALPPGRATIERLIRDYLSAEHRDDPGQGCPSAALLDEIGRCDQRVRRKYSAGAQSIINAIASRLLPEDPHAARARATGLFAIIVGTMQLARAMSDPAVSAQVLEAGIANALDLVDIETRSSSS